MMTMSERTALYLRLSKEDGTAERSSIATQRAMLQDYAKVQGFTVTHEYIDDGYSGTSFHRPAFSRMLRDIEAGKIDIILTKDLSRLGRDYIAAGQFTEQYFPAKGIRYIAVNDGYDSAQSDNDIVPFKNILNELYARDISRKIRSSIRTKMQNGKYIAAFAPYGYHKDPADRNHLVIDEAVRDIVQNIFHAAAKGNPPTEIAKCLNARGCPAPLAYRALQSCSPNNMERFPPWSAATITKMLHNEVYLGHSVQGKTQKASFKENRSIRVLPHDRISVKNTHAPIIDADTFHLANRQLTARKRKNTGKFSNLFSGIAFCTDCNKAMSSVGTRKKGSPAMLTCGGYKLRGKGACSNHFIDYQVLEHIVLSVLQTSLSLSEAEADTIVDHTLSQFEKERMHAEIKHDTLQQRKHTVEHILTTLYEDHASGKLDDEQHARLLDRYTHELQSLKQTNGGNDSLDCQNPNFLRPIIVSALHELCHPKVLTKAILFSLIDRIEIGQGSYETTALGRIRRQKITIYLRFSSAPIEKEYHL